jgi:murein DD-endopeptidase MepM/ murein hydrolase activator NlpD
MRSTLLMVLTLCITSFAFGQLGGFGCPLDGQPTIRQGDAVAASGGRFDSSRGQGKRHGALDLNGAVGNTVYASLAGRVAVAQNNWGAMGNTVIIDHGSGAYTVYGHLDSILASEGNQVAKHAKIGTVGYSGNAGELKSKGLPPTFISHLFRRERAGSQIWENHFDK